MAGPGHVTTVPPLCEAVGDAVGRPVPDVVVWDGHGPDVLDVFADYEQVQLVLLASDGPQEVPLQRVTRMEQLDTPSRLIPLIGRLLAQPRRGSR